MDIANTNNNSQQNSKREIDDKKIIFHGYWTVKFSFTAKEIKSMCLICNTELAHNKVGNVKCHYETKQFFLKDIHQIQITKKKKKKRKLNC